MPNIKHKKNSEARKLRYLCAPGSTLTGKTHLHDIYTKTGRSGRMIFVVSRLEFYDADGVHLANSDSRIVMREKKS